MTERVRDRSPLWAALIAVASHATAIGGGYVWLDHAHIEQRLALADPSALPSLFTQGFAGTGFYRPLMALSLSLDAAVVKSPWLFHATTLAWHAAAAALLVVAARALGSSQRAAVAAGALFAAHPATSLVASAIAFRSEAMSLACLLALVVAHLKNRPIFAAVALFAGALSKETAWVLAPLFIVALEVTRASRGPLAAEAKPARSGLWVAEGLAFALSSGLHWLFAPAHRASHAALSWDEHFGTRLAALGKGLLGMALPVSSAVCDAFPASSTLSTQALLGAALLFLLLVTRFPSRRPLVLLLLALLPSLQLVPIMRWWSPHYFYVPWAFLAILMADLIEQRLERLWPAFALTGLGALFSLADARRYRDDASLWAAEVRAQPACREGHFYLGEVARAANDWHAAALHYERAAHPTPGFLAYADERAAFENLGAVELARGRWREARAAFSEALERTSLPEQRRRTLYNLALVALRSAEPSEAVRLLDLEADASHPLPEGLLVRARALHDLGREEEAERTLRKLASLEPGR